LFLSREGRISKRMVEILFRRYCSQAGIKLDKGKNVHILRHSRAIHILEKTGNIELVQDVLDHQDLKTTVHMYLRRTKEMPARFRESEKQQAVVTM
jgi:site-specific recombinase XerD